MFNSLQQSLVNKIKDQATSTRERFQAATERVLHEVVESETFKRHVAFNVDEHIWGLGALEGVSPDALPGASDDDNAQELVRIGVVRVFVSRVAGLKSLKKDVFIEIRVGNEIKRTRVSDNSQAFDFDRRMFDWAEEEDMLEFVVYDVKTTVACRVMAEQVLSEDKFIGQVCIPIERLLPAVVDEIKTSIMQSGKLLSHVEGPHVYELFPLPRNRTQFQPAVKGCAMTGMDKPPEALGYIRVKVEFIIDKSDSLPLIIARSYLNACQQRKRINQNALQNVILDVARTQRHVQRQVTRLENVIERLLIGPFAPTLSFSHARTWDSPRFSMAFISVVSVVLLHFPVYTWPLCFFCNVLTGGVLAREYGERKPLVWNSEIRDGDDSLNPMQRVAKLLWVLETMSKTLVAYADWLERVVHSFDFHDERSSMIIYMICFAVTLQFSAIIYFLAFRYILFGVFCLWMFAPLDFRAQYKTFVTLAKAGRSAPWPFWIQPLVNVMNRVPTSEYLGHLQICLMQRVNNESIIESVERIPSNKE